jgi:hypothetical protein
MLIIPAIWKDKVGEWWLKDNLSKVSVRLFLKNKLKGKELKTWLSDRTIA